MKTITGKFNSAIVYTDNVEQTAADQIKELCDQEAFKNSKIRIMPDTHAGKGCVIGTTMSILDKIVPNLVGVDIACGMLTVNLGKNHISMYNLDTYIRNNIPTGYKTNDNPFIDFTEELQSLRCYRELNKSSKEFNRALGTLGGGNHFVEIDVDNEGTQYLVIHSGSRNVGNQVAVYYQKRAGEYHNGLDDSYLEARERIIREYKEQGKRKDIAVALEDLKNKYKKDCNIEDHLCYLEGRLMEDYLHDMKILQTYAELNREVMAKRIVEENLGLTFNKLDHFQTVHNYLDLDNMILRKGAISAKYGEMVLIPINMRDGSLLCKGKGNPDWNYSAPHGAGRLMSRTKAAETIQLKDFQHVMKDVYTTSVNTSTLDESPFAYKPMQEIIDNVQDAVEIIKIIKSDYNFKDSKPEKE